MLDLLAERRRTTGELASAFPKLSRFAVMKHLRVLESAELVSVQREGRLRWNSINPVPLRQVFRKWVGRYEAIWADAMLDIRDAAEASAAGNPKPSGKDEGESP